MSKLIPKGGNDKVYTPIQLARSIINHFQPKGVILDPCMGDGAFYNNFPYTDESQSPHLKTSLWCEIDKGIDFFTFDTKVDWIISNFPWSQMRQFLIHSMKLSNNIVSLSLINAIFMRARLRDIKEFGFGIKEICLIEPIPPKPWPQTGLALGAIHLQKGYCGDIKFSDL